MMLLVRTEAHAPDSRALDPSHVAARAFAIDHVYYRPPPPLDSLIELMWAADDYPARAPRERVLPSGAAALVIHLDPQLLRVYADEGAREPAVASEAFFAGARQTPLILDTAMRSTVGVHFLPGGARRFFDIPADAVAEHALPLEGLWGSFVHSLRAQLAEAPTPLARVRILRDALIARVRRSLDMPSALRLSLQAFEQSDLPSVAEVNRRTGLSPKRLLALFREEVGLSPKAFWRVRRFRAALNDLDTGALRGAALACEHGYCDQAHFLREFRALAGSSPSEYLAARVLGTDHVSLYV